MLMVPSFKFFLLLAEVAWTKNLKKSDVKTTNFTFGNNKKKWVKHEVFPNKKEGKN